MSLIYSSEHKKIIMKLREARTEAGLTQANVAELIGRTQSYIAKLEAGQRKIEIITLKKLAAIYSKEINFFIEKNEKKS